MSMFYEIKLVEDTIAQFPISNQPKNIGKTEFITCPACWLVGYIVFSIGKTMIDKLV